jgi:hydroxymethylpyrimidine pyrophosphatase-like HAD family hydrolase
MIIAIDFDGTIVENEFPSIGPLRNGAQLYINKLHNDGHTIIIWTCRCGEDADNARKFLKTAGIPFHKFNENADENMALYTEDSRKVFADVYIDDRDIFGAPEWHTAYELIRIKSKYKKMPIHVNF